jgi:protein-disulfide isomerase
MTRREFISGAAPLVPWGLALAVGRGRYLVGSARAQTVSGLDLMDPGPLPDRVLGSSTATVTIIEYASMTCPHCAQFSTETFPEVKTRFIGTGKVRYIFREYPLDPLAVAASMLLRSVDEDKYYSVIDTLFRQQRQWVSDRIQPLMTVAVNQLGFTEKSFQACLADQQLRDRIYKAHDRAEKTFGVSTTPTFFINGDKHGGNLLIGQMEKLIADYSKP